MTYAVIYASATGNTKMLAEEIRKRLGKKECVCFGTVEEAGTAVRADIIFAGFWTDKGDCSEELGHFLEGLHGRRVFLFGTAGFGGAQSYFDQILERVKGHLAADNEVVGTYMCQGKMPQSVRKRYEGMMEQNPGDQRIKGMIENFDRAVQHPDEADLNMLGEAVRDVL
ncbi:MAG TPA: flavodoxin family protein [Candidatus Mediterraneibacter intestinavium]|nr:flavodoxin family protein [Candidatus Mediterraneibacter intestinavium]